MANKPKLRPEQTRRAKVEEMRRAQRAKERRKTLIFVGVAALVGLLLIAGVTIPLVLSWLHDRDVASTPIAKIGVPAAQAGCTAPTNDPVSGAGQHVGPGTSSPNTTRVQYSTVPPTSGKHFAAPATFEKKFYTASDAPPTEQLVHNLEHGYTIVWYDSTVTGDELQTLKDLSQRIPKMTKETSQEGKFIVTAWDNSHGSFPAGKHVAISHWSRTSGHREMCAKASGEVVESFVKAYPYSDAPEPNAA